MSDLKLKRWAGDLGGLVNRPKVTEDIIAPNYGEYYYLMFMLPLLTNATVMVETGMGMAMSARIHLEGLSMMNPPGVLHTFSQEIQNNEILKNYGDIPYDDIEKQVRDLNLPATWIRHQEDSVQGGYNWKGEKISLLYLDSDHSLEHVQKELDAWKIHMSDKAVIFTDDIWCQNTPHDAINKVNPGVCPTDPYWAFHNFSKENPEWRQITLSYPEGKAFLLRGFNIL